MNRSSETMKDISYLNKLGKAALIDWVLNSAEPQVMISCLLNRLSSMPADDEVKIVTEELRDMINQMPAREVESKHKSKKPKTVCKIKCENIGDMFKSLIGKDYDQVKKEIMDLDKDDQHKMVVMYNDVAVSIQKNDMKTKHKIQELLKFRNIFKALDNVGAFDIENTIYKFMDNLYKTKSGFGHASLQSYRRRLKSKSKSRKSKSKKSRKSKSRKSKSRKLRSKKLKSKKLKSKKTRKSKSTKSKFGKIYGLQNGPDWKGVFPMDLNVVGTLPTLLFGKSRKRKMRRSAKKSRKNRSTKKGARKSAKRIHKSRKSKKSKQRISFGAFTAPKPSTILR